MLDTITSTLDTIRNRDRICVSPIEGRYVLSDEARLKMDGLVESGEDIASDLAEYTVFLHGDIQRLSDLEEQKKRDGVPPHKKGFFSGLFGGKTPPPLPPELTHWDRRAQVKAALYALGRMSDNPVVASALMVLAQSRYRDFSDEARGYLKGMGIGVQDVWKNDLLGLPVVALEPGERALSLSEVIGALGNTAGFHLVDRRVEGDHFSFGASYTHAHDFFRVGPEVFVRRARAF
jgi:hypothetical protein